MLLVDSGASLEERMSYIEGLGMRSGFGDDRLRVWGLKFVLDGGVAGAALNDPYADEPTNRGHLNWDPDELYSVMSAAVRSGWKVATHAVGDRSVVTLLDTYERIVGASPDLPRGTLVIEHGFLAGREQRARAIRLGVAVTVQHQLLYNYAGELRERWGERRTAQVMPVRSWLQEGALVAGGTDAAKPFHTMLSLWGFVTRGTRDAGVQGPDQRLDPDTALALNTAAGAQLLGESDRLGTIQAGRLADVVALTADPITTQIDSLRSIEPALTLLAGRPTHDPQSLLGD